ncbi:MAG TPA: BON domain-containing protein [Candidatus Polarisedimenticolia bacterium]|nr:BON domain-containing protein [Candidatus Polarisedimenticolia bacterium]
MRLDRILPIAALALALLLSLPAVLASPKDAGIAAEVRQALNQSSELRQSSRLGVRCEEGILTISGGAATLHLLDDARRIAASVPGVVDVVMMARVSRGQVSDTQIRYALNQALRELSGALRELKAQVGLGKVVLTGSAGTYGQKQEVEETVSKIRGIVAIVNRIEVSATSNAGGALGRHVERKIVEDLPVRPAKLDVRMQDGKALLRGRVPLFLYRMQAENAALSVPGVVQVENHLIVDPALVSVPSGQESP